MWGVEGDVGEVGLFGIDLFFHPAECCLEEDIGAEAFGFYDGVVVEDEVVEVFGVLISDEVAELFLAESASSVDEDFIEASVVRDVLLAFITEVPFTEDAVFVASCLEGLGEGDDVEC